jgi:hypothetical protein
VIGIAVWDCCWDSDNIDSWDIVTILRVRVANYFRIVNVVPVVTMRWQFWWCDVATFLNVYTNEWLTVFPGLCLIGNVNRCTLGSYRVLLHSCDAYWLVNSGCCSRRPLSSKRPRNRRLEKLQSASHPTISNSRVLAKRETYEVCALWPPAISSQPQTNQ